MTDNTIRMRVLALLGPDGRLQLAQDLGVLQPQQSAAAFTSLSDDQQCQALLSAWDQSTRSNYLEELMLYATGDNWGDDDEGDDDE